MPVVSRTKILGIWVGLDNTVSNAYEWNFKEQLDKIRNICSSWTHRNLSIKGKVTIANALLISILQFPSSVTFTPQRVFTEYKRIVSDFIWDSKKPKIAYTSLIQPIEKGVVKLLDLHTRVTVNLLQWARTLIKKPQMNVGRTLGYILGLDDVSRIFSYRNLPVLISDDKFRFYKELMETWRKFRQFEPTSEAAIRNEPLWYNNHIGPPSSYIVWTKWQDKGIETKGQVCHEVEARLMSHLDISITYNFTCTFLEALSLRANIPISWRRALCANWQPQNLGAGIELKLDRDPPEDISILSPKRLYSKLITDNSKPNTAFQRWREGDDGLQLADQMEWANACSRIFQATRATKIQSFQYKLLNRLLPEKVFLKRLRKSDTDQCEYCNKKDSISHFLFTCNKVQRFWTTLCTWFAQVDNVYLDRLSLKEKVFGIAKDCHKSRIINTVLIHVRYFIHRQKLFYDGQLKLTQWLREFRKALKVEEWICNRTGKARHFKIWAPILKGLS